MKRLEKFRYITFGLLIGTLLSGFLLLLFHNNHSQDQIASLNLISLENQTNSFNQTSICTEIVSKININQADAEDLEKLPGVGEVKANALIEYRTRYGNFTSLEELLYVPGFSSTLLQSLYEYLCIE